MAGTSTPQQNREKRAAAEKSLDLIKDGMKIGLGTGTTATILVELLSDRIKDGLNIVGVPTSERTRRAAKAFGVPLTTLNEAPRLDLTIDGADEIDPALNLIKGGGGACLHEKVIAAASAKLVIIGDASKKVERLGAFPLPVEVLRFAHESIAGKLREQLNVTVELRLTSAAEPFVTDEGNYILDCHFQTIPDVTALSRTLSDMPGIVEHGLFLGMADIAFIGGPNGVEELARS